MNEIEAWKATGRRALRVARQQWPARQRALGTVLGLGALVGTALLAPQHHLTARHDRASRPAMMRPHFGARELGPAGRRYGWGPGRAGAPQEPAAPLPPPREPAPPPEAPAPPVAPAAPAAPVPPAPAGPAPPPAPPVSG